MQYRYYAVGRILVMLKQTKRRLIMSAKKVVVITMASLMIAGSGIAGQNEGRGKRGGENGERGGKNRQEQMERHNRHQRRPGGMGGGIDRLINNPKLREELGITDDQVDKLKDAKTELEDQRKDLIAEMKDAREAQMKLMQADELDKKAIMTAINQSGKLRTKMDKLRVKGLFRVQDILTDEQLSEVKERMRKGMQKHRKERDGSGKKNKKGQGKRNKDTD